MKKIIINESIISYLDEIADRLWSGHGAVMIGSGFSKLSNKNFPTWSELGDILYDKINNGKKEEKKYLNILKLAGEVEAAFGRASLDQVIRTNIPDKTSEPSELHKKILELPWNDVFTTNYDTLLEKACSSITSQKYDVVVNKEDLIYSEKPRIIKLHGSFPSNRPFIITEEDYRLYPINFAPFVNTVQQSLLENTLCLIGFSGDDPNFLQWIGWMRDNLGTISSPKIYIVGKMNLTDAQKKLLELRNIVVVDFSIIKEIENDHYKAIDLFIEYLLSKNKEDSSLEWPNKQKMLSPKIDISDSDKIKEIRDLVVEWRFIRLSFPGWIILPEDLRIQLWICTRFWLNIDFKKIIDTKPLDIEFSYELNWRLNKCLCPLLEQTSIIFEQIISVYWPFSNLEPIKEDSITPKMSINPDFNWDNIRNMWIELSLSLLRFYREKGELLKWQRIDNIFDKIIIFLSDDQIASLYYERCLHSLFELDIPKVRKHIESWPINESLSFWEAKRAGILAEIGQIIESEKILEKSLKNIRLRLNLIPIRTDFTFVSQEVYVMLLLGYINRSSSYLKGLIVIEDDHREFTKRWNVLKKYKCDPWSEVKYFENNLKHDFKSKENIITKKDFDLGMVNTTHYFDTDDKDVLLAWAFLRFLEEVGIPIKLPGVSFNSVSAKGAISRIAKFTPYLSMSSLIRIGEIDNVNVIFNREAINNLTVSTIEILVEHYIKAIKINQDDIISGNEILENNYGVKLTQVIPEILSRLSCKSTFDVKNKIFNLLLEIYKSDKKNKYKGINKLTKRLLSSYSNKQQIYLIPLLLEFPIPYDLDPISEMNFYNPFIFLRINSTNKITNVKEKIKNDHINYLIKQVSSKVINIRKWSILSLYKLYQLGLLDVSQSEEFSKHLWSNIDIHGFPEDTDLYKHEFLFLPKPKDIDVIVIFKKYILDTSFNIQKDVSDSSVAITDGHDPICIEMIGSCKYITWTYEEAEIIFKRTIEWWDKDKEFLRDKHKKGLFGSIEEEFKNRFHNLVDVLVVLVFPVFNSKIDKKILDIIQRLFKEYDEYGVLSIKLKAACINFFPEEVNAVFTLIEEGLLSFNEDEVTESLNAFLIVLEKEQFDKNKNKINSIICQLIQILKWRQFVAINNVIKTLSIIFDKYSNFITNDHEVDVLNEISKFTKYTDAKFKNINIEFTTKIEIRKSIAYIAYTLYEYYNKKSLSIPEVISNWEKICQSDNEFAEVRNQWLDNK